MSKMDKIWTILIIFWTGSSLHAFAEPIFVCYYVVDPAVCVMGFTC